MEPTESKNRFVDSVILTQFGEYDSIKVIEIINYIFSILYIIKEIIK